MKRTLAAGMIALSLLFGASRLEASSQEHNRFSNSLTFQRAAGRIEKNLEQTESSGEIKKNEVLNSLIRSIMADVKKQSSSSQQIRHDHVLKQSPSSLYEGKSVTLSTNYELKNDEKRIARLGADFTLDEFRKPKSIIVKGEHDLGSIVMNYDVKSRNNIISLTAGKKSYTTNIVLRNGDPTISAKARLCKEASLSSTYSPSSHYFSASLSGELNKGLRYNINRERIRDKEKTSVLLAYNLPKTWNGFVEEVSYEHFSYEKRHGNKFQAKGRLGPLNFSFGLDNYLNPKTYSPRFRIDFKKSF